MADPQSHTTGYISLFISYNEKRGESTIHQIVMEINVSQRFQYTRVDVSTITFCYYVCKSSEKKQKPQILHQLFHGETPFLTLCTNIQQTRMYKARNVQTFKHIYWTSRNVMSPKTKDFNYFNNFN